MGGGISRALRLFIMAFQGDSIFWVEVEKITPNPFQPRREFDQARLDELSESIRMYGILQPLTVTRREIQRDNGAFYTEYELIAGERRLRAAKQADISLVPVIIREGDQSEQEKLELAIIENLQREDLNAVDRALAFRQLADTFKLSHAQVAKKVGRSREYVSNTVRLLALPEHMLQALRNGDISEGHGRTLLMMSEQPEEQETVFREIMIKKLSVREVERIARSVATDKVRRKDKYYDPEIIALEKQFTETLGTRVQIQKTEFGGKLTIDYFSADDLTYMLERMRAEAAQEAMSGRRPFSPPSDTTAVSDSMATEQVDQLSEATPLSALIAQLQQAESQYSEPVREDVTAVDNEPALMEDPVTLPDVLPVAATQTVNDEIADGSETADVRVTFTNAPVSPVTDQPAQVSVAEHTFKSVQTKNVDSFTPEVSPAAAAEPRVVCINRDCTTAVYVAAAPTQPTHATHPQPQSSPLSVQAPPADDFSDLYSIRNFNI